MNDDGGSPHYPIGLVVENQPPVCTWLVDCLVAAFPDMIVSGVASLRDADRAQSRGATWLGRGLTVPETARRLGLSEHTAASYVKIIYSKLNISSRAQAALEAQRRGLI